MAHNALSFDIKGPSILPPPRGTLRSGQYLKGFVRLVRDLRGNYSKILEKSEINSAVVNDPDFPLGWMSAITLLEYCSQTLDDDLFGLHLADFQDAEIYGCVAHLARAAPNLREGIQSLIDFIPLVHSPGANAELVSTNRIAELRWHPCADFSHFEQANYHGLMLSIKLLTSLVGGAFHPVYASSVTAGRAHRDVIARRLGCVVHWAGSYDAIAFSPELLDRPLNSANPIVFGLLTSYLSQLKPNGRLTCVDQIEAYVSLALRTGNCAIDDCAARLGTSARSLQTRLAAQGTSFSNIVTAQRVAIAKELLTNSTRSLDEIADYLGYSERSSFGRAFKRSVHASPQEYRRNAALRVTDAGSFLLPTS